MGFKEKAFLLILIVATIMITIFSQPEGSHVVSPTATESIVYRTPNLLKRSGREMSRWSSHLFFTPGQKTLEWLFRGMEPITPGENYQSKSEGVEQWKRIKYLALAIITAPLAIVTTLVGFATYFTSTYLAHRIHYVPPQKVPPKKRAGEGLTLMTYNSALTHTFVCAFTHVRPPFERAHEIAEKVLKVRPDVVVFQECLHAKDPIAHRLSQEGYHVFRDVALNPTGSESGLITASTLPVEHAEFFHIGNYIGAEALSNRGLFEVQLRLPSGKKVAVYNLHLQSGGDRPEVVEARSKQVDTVFKIARGRLNGDPELTAAFIGGDWNVSEFGEEGYRTQQWGQKPLSQMNPFRNVLYEAKAKGRLARINSKNESVPVDQQENPGTFWNLHDGQGWGTAQGDLSLKEQEGCNPDHILVLSKEDHKIKINKVELRHDFGDSSDHFPLTANVDIQFKP